MPSLPLISRLRAACRSSSSCFEFANCPFSPGDSGKLSKSNLSTWIAILQEGETQQRINQEDNLFCWLLENQHVPARDGTMNHCRNSKQTHPKKME